MINLYKQDQVEEVTFTHLTRNISFEIYISAILNKCYNSNTHVRLHSLKHIRSIQQYNTFRFTRSIRLPEN